MTRNTFLISLYIQRGQSGSWNGTRYSNSAIDKKIVSLASQTDLEKRRHNSSRSQIQQDLLYLPIHHQVLNWGMANKVQTTVSPDDRRASNISLSTKSNKVEQALKY